MRVSKYTNPLVPLFHTSSGAFAPDHLFCNAYLLLPCFIGGHALTLFMASLPSAQILTVVLFATILVHRRWRVLCPLIAIILGILVATIRFQNFIDQGLPSEWQRRDITLVAKVISLPKQRRQDISFRVRVIEQNLSPDLTDLPGNRLQLSCYRCPFNIEPAQTWRFTVRLKQPHGYASPGAFDYEKYLFRHRLVAKGYVRLKGENQRLKSNRFDINLWRLSIKRKLASTLGMEANDTGDGYSTMVALAVGDKSGFSQSQRIALQVSGLSHLFAISGLHIGLIFAVTMMLFKWLSNGVARLFEFIPRPFLCLLPAMGCAVLYAALAGFSVSTQRALIMLCVFVVCRLMVRDVSLFKVLLIAICILLQIDPFSILDAGFWLSCGAVLVICLAAADDAELSLIKLQPILWLGMMPLTILFFSQLSWLSPLLNFVAVPVFCAVLIPLTLVSTLINQIGLVVLAKPLLLGLNWAFDGIFSILEFLVAQPYAKTDVPEFEFLHGVIFVICMGLYVYRKPWWHIAWCLFLVSLLVSSFASAKPEHLKITLLDVGQGLAMVIQTSSGITVYDTGPRYASGFTAAGAVLLPYLRSQGIKAVDRLIISHADNDHFGGYDAVVDAFPVKQVLTSRIDKLPDAKECIAGQSWGEGDTEFSILSPQSNTPHGSNNRSCVLKLRHQSTTVLITGDIEKQVERFLLKKRIELTADILLVPHQGSKTSSTERFIDAVQPSLALVAAGYLNHYRHPHRSVSQRYADRGIELLSTASSGTIEIDIDTDGFEVAEYRQQNRRFWHWR